LIALRSMVNGMEIIFPVWLSLTGLGALRLPPLRKAGKQTWHVLES
jgi:hypothetical protein